MTANVPVKAVSAGELKKLRNTSEVVFTARVNQSTPLTNTYELTYDGGTGTYTDIKTGYIVWIGSAAGLHNRGITHVRTTTTATKILTNHIDFTFADNDYITVISKGGQASKLGLYIQRPATVYTMRADGTPASLDGLASFVYKSGSGTYTDAIAGMTVLVSATAYGKHDKGIYRLRKALPSATTGTLSINATSRLNLADDDYITIVKSFSLLQKDAVISGADILMDYDIPFGSYLNGGCIPRIGGIVSVINQTDGTITFTPPSPSLSACYDGATISSYLYNAPGASTTSNMTAGDGTASWTYPLTANQEYLWSCAITDSVGRVTTSYRWVVVNPTSETFQLQSCSGSFDSGGWAFKARSYSDMSDVYDRAMITLYTSLESYNKTQGAIGKLAGYENILATGWIDGKTISINPVEGYIEFEVKDASYWLSKTNTAPVEFTDTAGVPATWNEINEITVDKALAHLLFWYSTAPFIMDCFFTDSTIRTSRLDSPSDNLWQQMTDISQKLFAVPLCNSLGQIFIEIDSQILSDADRAGIVVVQDIEKQDYQDGCDIQVNTTDEVSLLDISGVSAWDGTNEYPLYAKAPGTIGGSLGNPSQTDNYVFDSQAECNRIAGRYLFLQNNPYETIDLELSSQNKFIDICPRQFVTKDISSADNPLGLDFTATLIPRSIDYDYNPDSGFLKPTISFEFVVENTIDGITFIPPLPLDEDTSEDYQTPDYMDGVKFPSALGSFFPSFLPEGITDPTCSNISINHYSVVWDKKEIRGDALTTADRISRIYFPCTLHGSGGYPSNVQITGFQGDAASSYTLYGIKDGARIITADSNNEFNPVSATPIDGFEIEIDAGLGVGVVWIAKDIIASGRVNADDDTGPSIDTVANQYYAVENDGTAWWDGAAWNYGASFRGAVIYQDVQILTSYIYRNFYLAQATAARVTVSDTVYAGNSGDTGYTVRNADVYGRKILLGSTTVNNVCP